MKGLRLLRRSRPGAVSTFLPLEAFAAIAGTLVGKHLPGCGLSRRPVGDRTIQRGGEDIWGLRLPIRGSLHSPWQPSLPENAEVVHARELASNSQPLERCRDLGASASLEQLPPDLIPNRWRE